MPRRSYASPLMPAPPTLCVRDVGAGLVGRRGALLWLRAPAQTVKAAGIVPTAYGTAKNPGYRFICAITTTRCESTQYGVQLISASVGRARGAVSIPTSVGLTVLTERTTYVKRWGAVATWTTSPRRKRAR